MNICLDVKYCGAPGSVGSLSRFFALPADMAPHLPDNVSWDEAGALQPLAIGVQIGKRVDLRAHQSVAIMGCGPIGLIAAAVAHSYSAKSIVGFDINPKRVDFARAYKSPITGKPIFDSVFLVTDLPSKQADLDAERSSGVNGRNGHAHSAEEMTTGDVKYEAAKFRAAGYLRQMGENVDADGVDRVIEASGAEDAGMLGVAIAKQGAICKLPKVWTDTRPGCRTWTSPNVPVPHFGSNQQRARCEGYNALHVHLLPRRNRYAPPWCC